MKPKPSAEERFWAKVAKLDGENACWIWTAAKLKTGYGMLGINKKPVLAHRYSYELHYGPVPKGLYVCHHCDNPQCVRPDHLFAGSGKDNMADMDAKGRRVTNITEKMMAAVRAPKPYIQGEKHFKAKLTAQQVVAIREAYAGGRSLLQLIDDYGMSAGSMTCIIRGQTWKTAGGPIFPNERRRVNKGESHCHAKMNEDMVREARRRYDAGERITDIAALLGISQPVINTVVKRKAWKHVEGPAPTRQPEENRGSNHAHAKLTEEIVRDARKMHAQGAGIRELSKLHGVSASVMGDALARRSWKHVT